MRTHWPRFVLGASAALLLVWLLATGAHRQIDPAAVREQVRLAGSSGVALYLLAFGFIQPLGISGHLFVIAASLIWSAPTAFALSLLGATLGQINAFFFFRYIAHDWAQKRIPQRLLRYEQAFVERPLRTVLLFRLISFTWVFSPAILGLSRVRFWPMCIATVFGLMPGVAIDVWLGAGAVEWLLAQWRSY